MSNTTPWIPESYSERQARQVREIQEIERNIQQTQGTMNCCCATLKSIFTCYGHHGIAATTYIVTCIGSAALASNASEISGQNYDANSAIYGCGTVIAITSAFSALYNSGKFLYNKCCTNVNEATADNPTHGARQV